MGVSSPHPVVRRERRNAIFFVESKQPAGTIAVITHELSRYADFSISMTSVQAPPHSQILWHKGVEIASGLNMIIRHMIGEWLFILGDDHVFKPDIIFKLLELDVDIVAPVCSNRTYPHLPVVFKERIEGGKFNRMLWTEIPHNQLFEVAASGTAGMLIRKRVLDAVGDPWFECGQTKSDNLGEDLWFCSKSIDKGFKVHVHSGIAIGHITPATIWPYFVEGKLTPLANFNGNEDFWVRLDQGLAPIKAEPPAKAPSEEPVQAIPQPES